MSYTILDGLVITEIGLVGSVLGVKSCDLINRPDIFTVGIVKCQVMYVELYLHVGQFSGYRTVWKLLRTRYGLRVGKETIRHYLRYRDPIAVENRQAHRLHRRTYHSRGPNDQWHADGYDKLKKYGIAVSGCIDGYSRRIIWLQCSCSNNDPGVIASYYLNAAKVLYVCPRQCARKIRFIGNCILQSNNVITCACTGRQ